MKHVMDVLSVYAGRDMLDVIETTEVTEILHVTEGFAINSSPNRDTEVQLYA